MTLNDFRTQAIHALESITDNPRFEAEQLIMWVLKLNRNELTLKRRETLTPLSASHLNDALNRRLSREPLQYICGEWDFYGLTFKVDRSVLIPRSDTERLCELVIEQAKERVSPRILDLCCGSGCIGIAAAHTVEDARVTAIDLSDGALHITRENARDLGVSSRLLTMKADVMHAPPRGLGQFDIIVSNPPYVTEDEM